MRWKWALGACVLAAGVAAVVVALVVRGGGETLNAAGFRLSYPTSWRVVPGRDGGSLAVLVRKDGGGRVTITRDLPERTLDGARLRKQLSADFSERLEAYHLLSAALERTGAGSIFVYSYTPPGTSAVHTDALVPAGNHSFLLSSVAGPGAGAGEALRQVRSIIRSFRPR